MKLVVDVSENYYRECIKDSKYNIGTCRMIANGAPLTEVFENIKNEIESHIIDSNGFDFNSALYIAIEIVRNHIGADLEREK